MGIKIFLPVCIESIRGLINFVGTWKKLHFAIINYHSFASFRTHFFLRDFSIFVIKLAKIVFTGSTFQGFTAKKTRKYSIAIDDYRVPAAFIRSTSLFKRRIIFSGEYF